MHDALKSGGCIRLLQLAAHTVLDTARNPWPILNRNTRRLPRERATFLGVRCENRHGERPLQVLGRVATLAADVAPEAVGPSTRE